MRWCRDGEEMGELQNCLPSEADTIIRLGGKNWFLKVQNPG